MRPLVVLFLVVGALGALMFALSAISGTDRKGDAERTLEVAADRPADRAPTGDLVPAGPAEQEVEQDRTPGGTRTSITEVDDDLGSAVPFGSIAGRVITEEGAPIGEATVVLRNGRPSPYGEDAHLMTDEPPPKVHKRMVTDETGEFRFDHLDPRKDWEIVVTHETFQKWTSDMAIPVPEGDVWLETVVMAPGHDFFGTVTDANTGQPIAGVTLTATSAFARMGRKGKQGGNVMEAVTDEAGAFRFYNVTSSPSTPRVLTITAPEYATQVHPNFLMLAYAPPQRRFKNKQEGTAPASREQNFELLPATVIAGRVVGPDRSGVRGVEVQALNQSGSFGSQGEAVTGKNGEFLIEGLAEGLYTVRVSANNLDAKPLQRVEAGDTNVLIELFELAMVTGRVVDQASGAPLSNFLVKARSANDFDYAYGQVATEKQVKGSTDGSFELKGLPDGDYVIEGQADGYASCFSDRFTATQGLVTSDIVVRMNRGGGVTGRVLDAYTNQPVQGLKVSTFENDYIEGEIFGLFVDSTALTKKTTFTGSDGRYSVDVMTPGKYQVRIEGKGFSPHIVQEINVVAGAATEVPTQMVIKGATIVGTVYGRDRAVCPGANIQLYPVDPSDTLVHRLTRADGTGRYIIPNMRPGIYTLSATRPNRNAGNPFEALGDMKQSEIKISIDDGEEYEFDLHLGPH